VSEPDLGELLQRARAAAGRRWPGASVAELEPLPGGISSLTFSSWLVEASGRRRRVVVKVAPPGLPAVRNRDVLRQARAMVAVHGALGVRVPEVLLSDDGDPPLFVMQFIAGEAYEPRWDISPAPPTPATVRARAVSAATMLGHLHALQPGRVGLGAEPAVALSDELDRWARLFATAGDDLRGDEAALYRALSTTIPSAIGPRIVHGDYRLGNLLFEGHGPPAIIDWELWSLGDPRTDLAWLLHFTDPAIRRSANRDAANGEAAAAMPDRRRLLAQYLAVAGADPGELSWFAAYCHYKLASAMAVLAKRNRRLPDPDPGLELAAATLAPAIERGLEILSGNPGASRHGSGPTESGS
jgi:aminoglycoside phosphotransferase (APT) family kinase protein